MQPEPAPAAGRPEHAVLVEVLLLRADQGALLYRVVRAPLPAGATPDEAAREHAGGDVDVLHSTSWRHQDGRIVLTYAALPDPRPDRPATALWQPAIMSSGDPRVPTPPGLHLHHVAAHAVRHLAELAGRDPAVVTAAGDSADQDLWAAVAAAAARIPTGTHALAHRAAAAAYRPPAPPTTPPASAVEESLLLRAGA